MRRPNSSGVLTIAYPAHWPGHPRHRTRALLATVAMTTTSIVITALLRQLDTSFGVNGDGKVLHNMSSTSGQGGMAVQPDDSIIEVGGVGGRIVVDRFSADGALISSSQKRYRNRRVGSGKPAGGRGDPRWSKRKPRRDRQVDCRGGLGIALPGTWEREVADMNVIPTLDLGHENSM